MDLLDIQLKTNFEAKDITIVNYNATLEQIKAYLEAIGVKVMSIEYPEYPDFPEDLSMLFTTDVPPPTSNIITYGKITSEMVIGEGTTPSNPISLSPGIVLSDAFVMFEQKIYFKLSTFRSSIFRITATADNSIEMWLYDETFSYMGKSSDGSTLAEPLTSWTDYYLSVFPTEDNEVFPFDISLADLYPPVVLDSVENLSATSVRIHLTNNFGEGNEVWIAVDVYDEEWDYYEYDDIDTVGGSSIFMDFDNLVSGTVYFIDVYPEDYTDDEYPDYLTFEFVKD